MEPTKNEKSPRYEDSFRKPTLIKLYIDENYNFIYPTNL